MVQYKVLILEDYLPNQILFKDMLCDTFIIPLPAYTIEEASRFFDENPDIEIVVVDGCINSKKINTIEFVKIIRGKFKKPIVSISESERNQNKLLAAGCDFKCTKLKLPRFLTDLIAQLCKGGD